MTTAGRVVFALSFNASRLRSTFFPSAIKTVLVTYYYIRAKSKRGTITKNRLMKQVREHADTVFIDSGVFSLKVRFMQAHVLSRITSLPIEEIERRQKLCLDNYVYFERFAKNYAIWLAKNDKMYDWAFDLDVDEFLGLDVAENFYKMLKKNVPNPKKILRVWHSIYRTYEDWCKWCESGEYEYLALEGPAPHRWNPDFYRRLVDKAHKHEIKVHVLACTEPNFFRLVSFDTGDSSSWMVGSRYGYIYTPYGTVSYANKSGSSSSMPNYTTVPTERKEKIIRWMRKNGLDYEWGDMAKSWEAREFINIQFFLDMDKKYIVDGQVYRKGFLEV